ncbi:hypothetical protein [Pseudomonas denitrificans (nom. rej.)]|uniref:hypothetical protein n=1 Tax=Pseudomonas denitrificans TaxID=43306 RepID=UPI001E34AFEA|nr:hypothetical protein [Pseudomonas denitrificans (nom. rej.)]
MKFKTLEIIANGASGWGSGELEFGQVVTQLYATNESGKTPLIMSILFCLGLDVKFRADITRNSRLARLKVSIATRELEFERIIGEKFDVTIRESGNTIDRFYNDEQLSKFIFSELKIKIDRLITSNGIPTTPYFSGIIPLFYLDQDEGYSEFYAPRHTYIKDQYTEMVRLISKLPAINIYDKKRKAIDIRKEVEYLDSTVVSSRKLLERLQQDLPVPIRSAELIDQQLANAKERMLSLKDSKNIKSEAISGLDEILSEHRSRLIELTQEQRKLELKIRGFNTIKNEIESEIETLNLNEDARRAFISFSELCSTPSCGMFMASAESYGKSLLYLKDQIKDLEISTAANLQIAESIQTRKVVLEKRIEELNLQRSLAERESGVSAFIEAISRTTTEIFELQQEKEKLNKIEEQKKQHIKIIERREQALTLQESLERTQEQSAEVVRLRLQLSAGMAKWLNVLHARNIPETVRIDPSLKPIMGEEKLDIFKGSSKARTVLAYHAALFEICLSDPSSPFRVLILDTPKQQDIPNEHLDSYINALQELAAKDNGQVIFSTSSYRYNINEKTDKEWLPSFPSEKELMYLGPPDSSPQAS